MKHAVLIMAHNNWEVVKCLLHQLDIPEFDIFLHVNAKVSDFPQTELKHCLEHAKFQLVPRVKVGYCDYTMVEAVMSLFRTAFQSYHDYYHLISGADLLATTRKEFLAFFEQNNGTEFVGFSPTYSRERIFYRNYFVAWGRQASPFRSKVFMKLRKWLISSQRILGLEKQFSPEWTPRKGTDWYSITHNAVRYILEKETEFRKHFYHSFCPTEFLPHTILGNNPVFKEKLYCPDADESIQCIRTIDWQRGQPYVFRLADFESIINSPGMFARKFDEHIDMAIVDRLCEYVITH